MSSDEWEDDDLVLVIDNGTSTCKAGFAGNKTVSCHIPTAIGIPSSGFESIDVENRRYIGEIVSEKRMQLLLRNPIQRGIICDFDDMEEFWNHLIYQELRVKEPFSVLLTEHPSNSKANRDKMAEIMFEKLGADKVSIVLNHELALMASGRTDGVIIDSGEEQTSIVCITDGSANRNSVVQLDLGGFDLSRFLTRIMNTKNGKHQLEWVDIQNIKHAHCYIAMEYEDEMSKYFEDRNLHRSYESQLGEEIAIGAERIQCPEILFQPSIIEKDFEGIQYATIKSISKCDLNVQKEMYRNIIFSGGNTILRNITERMEKEMSKLLPTDTILKVVAPPERLKSVWIGGSILGSLDSYKERFITKEQYTERGSYFF